MITPVILSGGSGTRLWPLSRTKYPKQFINLLKKNSSLLQETILRLPNNTANPIIVCNKDHRFIAAEQLREINKTTSGIILEPVGRNTAPAVTLAALKSIKDKEDSVMLVLSADHLIKNISSFHESIKLGESLALQNQLVVFGITPIRAETGYGYIEAKLENNSKSFKVESFKEKPLIDDAERYFKSKNFLWNSGIFMFKASVFLKELEKFNPVIINACRNALASEEIDSEFIRLIDEEFKKSPNISIDYAVMEKTRNAAVIKLDSEWSDVGSWSSLYDAKPKDSNKNVIEGDVVIKEVSNSYIHSSNKLISASGISNLVIIDTPDALLVANKNKTQNIGQIVTGLQNNNRSETNDHRKVYRPWGYYDRIESGTGFQVKRIVLNPKAKISLQKHEFRSEHWVVIKGNALVVNGKNKFKLNENQSTYIAKGEVHRLENLNDVELEIIEIQTGEYLGEDDIIRLDDDYSRK